MHSDIRQILAIMESDMPMAGTTSMLSGGGAAQMAQEVGMDIMPGDFAPDGVEVEVEEETCCDPELLELAQELVARAGGADQAREIIDKVQDVQEVLGVDDGAAIAQIADMMPSTPDMPTNMSNSLGMSAMFDPGGNTHM